MVQGVKMVFTEKAKNQRKQDHSEELDLHAITSYERKHFALFGIYPLPPGSRILANFLHVVGYIVLLILSSLLIISMGITLLLGADNLTEWTNIMYYFMTQFAYWIKVIIVTMNRRNLPLLEEYLRSATPYKYYKLYGWKYLKNAIGFCTLMGRIYRGSVIICGIFFMLQPILSEDVYLPMGGWMPIDKQTYRIPLTIVQMSCYFVSAWTNSSLDIMPSFYIIMGAGYLRLFKTCITNIDFTWPHANNTITLEMRKLKKQSGFDENRIGRASETPLPADALEELVKMHKHIIAYITLVESTFSYSIFFQFLVSVCVICITGFQLLVVPLASAQFLQLIFFFICLLVQVVLYCWYGNEILFESDGIGEACYMTNWYDAPQVAKKNICLIMERSKRNIVVTAGKFFILSLPTLVTLAKSSYSYFAVLRHMYDSN